MRNVILFLIMIWVPSLATAESPLTLPEPQIGEQGNRQSSFCSHRGVTKPAKGARLQRGKTYTIAWPSIYYGMTVRILLYRSDKFYKHLGTTRDDGLAGWRVPKNIPTGSSYRLIVQTLVGPTYWYTCSELFSIVATSSGGSGGYKICKTGSKNMKWPSKKMYYYVNTKGGPSGALGAIKRGASVWNRVKGSSFKFIYRGKTKSKAYKYDGWNIVSFGPLSVGTVGQNRKTVYTSTGQIIDSDIRFNTRYKWSTKKAKNAYDVQGVAAHEFGHSLCLDHITGKKYKDHTMYPSGTPASSIKMRTLESGDKRGIQALY